MNRLHSGMLFDERYQLVKQLGEGASAQVWLAYDTMANNLKVAIKILSGISGMDTRGVQNFQREFTYVYNIQHQNLLTPSNYAICEKTPYLVLPYCENGSATSMIGRVEEQDVIKFLHDVSAGLECLHTHNIIHQDIKPDNILLDDECNFLVTDFGISTQAAGAAKPGSGSFGGTRAYMGPERFEEEAFPINMNDIWALGATAYELLTGNAPFGDNGGMVQQLGETIPELPDSIQPELRKIIMTCLEPEPWNRPSAEAIRKKTQLYLETGSWKAKDGKGYLYGSILIAAILLFGAGLWIWDYNRTKIFYYKDYTEYWGVPKGIGRLRGSEMRHRQCSYRFEYSKYKLRRLSLVNPEGHLTRHTDTETMISRYTDVRFYYTDNGNVDYKTVSDQAGRLLFKMDYDESLKTVTFRQNDEYGTEMNLRANTTDLQNQGRGLYENKSRISRYLLTYDDKGLLTQLKYVGLQNVPAGDAENIFGIRYKYDDKGHKVEEQFLGADGEPTSNGIGLSIKRFYYDDSDNWCEVRYLNIDEEPSHDGNNCPLVKIENDKWGNRIRETYYTIEEEPAIRKDAGIAGYGYEYDEQGHCVTQYCIGLDGKWMTCKYGFAANKMSYDENGYISQQLFIDIDGNPVCKLDDNGDSYCRVDLLNNIYGLALECSLFDEEGQPLETRHGYSRQVMAYDSVGNQISVEYFNKEGKSQKYDGLYSLVKVQYDEFSHVTAIRYFGPDGKPASDEDGVSCFCSEYNRQGALVKMSYYGIDEKPVMGGEYYSVRTVDYDELGNEKNIQFYDTEGALTNNIHGFARRELTYDSKTNFCIVIKDFDDKGSLKSSQNRSFDKRGNIIREALVNGSGQLKQGTAVEHTEYNQNNLPEKKWWTDLKDKLMNKPGTKVAKMLAVYDSRGNIIEQTFWDANNRPSVDEQGAFKRVRRFNDQGLAVYERNLDVNEKPLTGKNVNPEGRVEYDRMGNVTKVECFDGYGKPRLSSDGFFRMIRKFNKQNKIVEVAFFDVNGKLVVSKSNEFAKKTMQWNSKGMETRADYYNEKNQLFRSDLVKYNEKNRLVEQVIQNERGQLDDKFWGYSKYIISYDKNGLVPVQRSYYNQRGSKLGYQNYNTATKEWGKMVLTGQQSFNAMGGNWRQALVEMSALCPMDVGNGIQLRSITVDGDVVTCVMRMTQVSVDDLNDEQRNGIQNAMGGVTAQIKKGLGIPSAVRFILIVQDKEGKRF